MILIYIILGIIIGMYMMYTQFKIISLAKRIEGVKNSFPSTEDIAKEILNIKMPIDDLPQETVDMIKKESKNRPKDSYFG